MIGRIKELLYEEGYTIAGAKKRLQAELEDGRAFALPGAESDLFEAGPGDEDEPPVIEVDALGEATSEPEDEPAEESEASAAATPDEQPGPEGASPAAEPAAVAAAVAEDVTQIVAEESAGAPAVAESSVSPVGEVEAEPESRESATAATMEPTGKEPPAATLRRRRRKAPVDRAPAASLVVDSALDKRIETLEHGLRRVLGEVRQLRDLLADSSEDR